MSGLRLRRRPASPGHPALTRKLRIQRDVTRRSEADHVPSGSGAQAWAVSSRLRLTSLLSRVQPSVWGYRVGAALTHPDGLASALARSMQFTVQMNGSLELTMPSTSGTITLYGLVFLPRSGDSSSSRIRCARSFRWRRRRAYRPAGRERPRRARRRRSAPPVSSCQAWRIHERGAFPRCERTRRGAGRSRGC